MAIKGILKRARGRWLAKHSKAPPWQATEDIEVMLEMIEEQTWREMQRKYPDMFTGPRPRFPR